MKNMQITAGGFAAYKYNKVIFNNVIQVTFSNVIHYTSFSGFLYIFSDYRKFATNIGFEKIIYQARMCSVDEIKPVLSGEPCTICWTLRSSCHK